jgi:Na+-driven multidrug efflux pump
LLSVLGAIAVVALSRVAVPVLFGRDFDAALTPLVLLMPGIVAASATRVLGSFLFSQGRLIYSTYATFIALGLTIVLDIVLIPWLEVPGAAIASSAAYVAALMATLYWYGKVSGGSVTDALVVKADDVREWREALRRVRERLGWSASE